MSAIGFGRGQKRPTTCEEMREHAQNLRDRADRLISSAFDRLPPSTAVTGGSGWRKNFGKQSDRAHRGLENAHAKAEELRKAAGKWSTRANNCDPVFLAELERQDNIKQNAKRIVKDMDKQARKSAVLVNDPAAQAHMTSAEWKAIHKDYKSIVVRGATKHRTAMVDGGLPDVYLTDKPTRLASCLL